MSNFYSERKVKKTRKDHTCTGCLEKILKGSTASYIAGANDDGFQAYYLCAPCRDYLDRNPCEGGDFWTEGELGSIRRQEEREAKT